MKDRKQRTIAGLDETLPERIVPGLEDASAQSGRTIAGLDETLPKRIVPGLEGAIARSEGFASGLAEGQARARAFRSGLAEGTARMRAFESGLAQHRAAQHAFEAASRLSPALQLAQDVQRRLGPPPALRAMMDMQRRLGVGRFAASPFRSMPGLGLTMPDLGLASLRGISPLHGVADTLRDHAGTWGPQVSTLMVSQQLREALGAQFTDHVSPVLSLATRLQEHMPGHPLRWREHLLGSIGPTLELHAALAPQRAALLAFQEQPQLGASLSWLADEEERTAVAALVPEGPRLPRVTVVGEVVCAVCGDELLVEDQTLRWRGNRADVETRVFPFCVRCFRRAGVDEDFMDDVLVVIEDFDRPLCFERLDGGGRGDGVPRGQLRLVPCDRDAGDDDAGDDDELE